MGRLTLLTLWEEQLGGKEKEAQMEVRMFLGLAVGLMAMSAVSAFRDDAPQQKWSPYKPRFRDDNDYNGRISRLAESSSGYYPSWQVAELGTMYKRGGGGVLGLPVPLARFSPAALASPAQTQLKAKSASAKARERITTSTYSHKLHKLEHANLSVLSPVKV